MSSCNGQDCLKACSESAMAELIEEVTGLREEHEKQNALLSEIGNALKEVGKNPMALMPALMGLMKGVKQ